MKSLFDRETTYLFKFEWGDVVGRVIEEDDTHVMLDDGKIYCVVSPSFHMAKPLKALSPEELEQQRLKYIQMIEAARGRSAYDD